MTIGYFTSPRTAAILVVMDFPNWIAHIREQGFETTPRLTREAYTPEVVAYLERDDRAPAWAYRDFDELIDDEIKSGANFAHLQALQRLTVQVIDCAPEPQRAHYYLL